MATETGRRRLEFQDLHEAVRDAETLHAAGYRRVGTWELAQACGHLAEFLTFAVDGFPRLPMAVRPVMFVMRKAFAPSILRKTLATGEMSGGAPTMPATIPSPGSDEAEAVARLRLAVDRFRSHAGPYQPWPLFGPMSREDATRLQLIHCAHHLGHLIPNAPRTEGGGD